MHRLNRPPRPACVPDGCTYREIDNAQLRTELVAMQGERCAYCERRVVNEYKAGHVEHFIRQVDDNERQADWSNLFWSCVDETTCGKLKDKRTKTKINLVIKPDETDPWELLAFDGTGGVAPMPDLPADMQARAKETIDAFGLDKNTLVSQRSDAIAPWKLQVDKLLNRAPGAIADFAGEIIETTKNYPFMSAIHQYLRQFA